MNEDLFGLGNDFWVLLKQSTTLSDVDLQPGIFFVDFPVKNDAANDGKKKFNDHPHV